jgi:two-component system chemotaxis sensor kinase CheA
VFGANPLALLDELRTLGPCEVRADLSALPELERLDPSVLHLAWDVSLRTAEPRRAIDDVFLFVADDGDIRVEELGEEEEQAPAAEDEHRGRGAEVVPLRPAPAASGPAAPADATAGEPGAPPRRPPAACGCRRRGSTCSWTRSASS